MQNHNNKCDECGCASRQDLVELVLAPLSALVEKARIELLRRVKAIDDSLEILAAQKKRELDAKQKELRRPS